MLALLLWSAMACTFSASRMAAYAVREPFLKLIPEKCNGLRSLNGALSSCSASGSVALRLRVNSALVIGFWSCAVQKTGADGTLI